MPDPAKVSRYRPAAASKALIQVNLEMECFNSAYDMKGTSTTDKPVMKPALDVVVYRRPAV
jgi:hypothetical protein